MLLLIFNPSANTPSIFYRIIDTLKEGHECGFADEVARPGRNIIKRRGRGCVRGCGMCMSRCLRRWLRRWLGKSWSGGSLLSMGLQDHITPFWLYSRGWALSGEGIL